MTLRELLRKREKIKPGDSSPSLAQHLPTETARKREVPEITFIRTTTSTEGRMSLASFPSDERLPKPSQDPTPLSVRKRSRSPFHRPSRRSLLPAGSVCEAEKHGLPEVAKEKKRLSAKLRLGSRTSSASSIHVPENLPDIDALPLQERTDDEKGAMWEKRATLLAQRECSVVQSRSPSAKHTETMPVRGPATHHVSINPDPESVEKDLQEAISLHEAGGLERSTAMFRTLADPHGANNALCQVLYGLALRHGWGCEKNAQQAIYYLTMAANSSALIESHALQQSSGGGTAKGELVLAIFELANCFRHGWGVDRDPIAAQKYYETAAELGDTDAMAEVAWCFLEGFGCKRSREKAARYLRMRERKGVKNLGDSWIWKEKYDAT